MNRTLVHLLLALTSAIASAEPEYTATVHYADSFIADRQSGDMQSVARTNQIPALLGQVFGIYYSVDGERPGKQILIKEVIRNERSEEYAHARSSTGDGNILAYSLDNQDDLAPGEWVMEIWHQDTLLASATFLVGDSYLPPGTQADGVVVSVCQDVRRTGTVRVQRICRAPSPP